MSTLLNKFEPTGRSLFSTTVSRAGFVAEISGVNLAERLDEPVFQALRDTWVLHPVLVFRDQGLDPAALERFAGGFGPFGSDPYVAPLAGHEHVIEVRREPRETAPIFGSSWHSDWSFQASPPSASASWPAPPSSKSGSPASRRA